MSVPPVASAVEEPTFALTYPLPARTGEPFTVQVQYSDGFIPAPETICRWEVRWGSVKALRENDFDETFGGMLFEGPASKGFCTEWTFTLPWVPEPRFEFSVDGSGASDVKSGIWPDRNLVTAEVVGTNRRIASSTLPIAQVLPDTYTPIVGRPVTYTRYLIGGATVTAADHPRWSARLGDGERPVIWEKWTTKSTFTITPPKSGPLFVGWDSESATTGFLLAGYYDPPVRYPDTTRPNTTPPVARLGGARLAAQVPITLTWSGTDRGWGIKRYRLQESVNGGPWTTITLPTLRTTSILRYVTPGTSVRYRVRAIDKAGNKGAWDYGPVLRPKVRSEASTAITYRGSWTTSADPTAHGGWLRESSTAGARAVFSFTGRGVSWVAERGPGHGKAKVYVDGALVKTVDLAAATDLPRGHVFRKHWSSVGHHTVRIVVSGTGTVDVDAFAILR